VEYKQTGWKLEPDGKHIIFTDGCGIGRLRLVGNPKRKAEKRLKRLHRQLPRKQKKSNNRKKARKQLAKAYLKVQRQREDFARKQASTLVSSHDLIAYEQLQIRNLVKNRHLAKSIYDAGWGTFLRWVKAYGLMHAIPIIAVAPQFTTQACSNCGVLVKKSLSMRTHICTSCGVVMDRDQNAALNILAKALERTVGHTGTSEPLCSGNASGQTASTHLSKRKMSKQAG
jgi:putative transposase